MNVQVNDVVRIARVPLSMGASADRLLGQIGFVEEIRHDRRRVLFQGIEHPGRPTNITAWVPFFCLEPVRDPSWQPVVAEYLRWFAELVREHEERQQRWRRELHQVATKHNLSVDEVREIVAELEFNGAVYE